MGALINEGASVFVADRIQEESGNWRWKTYWSKQKLAYSSFFLRILIVSVTAG